MEYPKMLYREGREIEWEGRSLDCFVVNDEAEEKAAVSQGWGGLEPKRAKK